MASILNDLIDRRILRQMAGGQSFSRGEEYFENDQVGDLAEYKETITAKVRGTRSYRVKLWAKDGELEYSCTCPIGEDGDFCKHCVATELAWLQGNSGTKLKAGKPSKPAVSMNDVRDWLNQQEKGTLVDCSLSRPWRMEVCVDNFL